MNTAEENLLKAIDEAFVKLSQLGILMIEIRPSEAAQIAKATAHLAKARNSVQAGDEMDATTELVNAYTVYPCTLYKDINGFGREV